MADLQTQLAVSTPALDQYLSMSTAIGLEPERSRGLWLEAKEELARLKEALRDAD